MLTIIRNLIMCAAVVAAPSLMAAPVIIPKAPEINANGWILIDAKTGKVLTEHNATEALPPASLTKMMTSYVVSKELHDGRIADDDMVPISEKAWRMGGSKMFVRVGTEVKLSKLMEGMIIASGNDATVALSEYVAGSEGAFADIMNQQAKLLGMNKTHFKNATGWPAKGHYTTAKDLSVLATHLIYDFPEHYALYKETSFTYTPPGEKEIRQPNRNGLLGLDPSVDGLKTGHTQAAGYCLVSSAKRQDTRLVAVVMGTKSPKARVRESAKLLQWGFRYFQTDQVVKSGDVIATPKIWKSTISSVDVVTAKDVVITLPRGSQSDVKYTTTVKDALVAPLAKGDVVGQMKVTLGDKELASVPLIVADDVPEAGFFKRIWDAIVMFFSGLI